MQHLADAGFTGFKISVVMTRENVGQLDAFKAIADRFDAQLRITRLRPSGRAVDVWDELHPTADQQHELYHWLLAHGEHVLTGDSFFHLAGYGESLPGLNLCGAGRVVCLIDPVGDVYACPFAIHDNFLAGNVAGDGGFADGLAQSELFTELRGPQSGGACASCSAYDACRGGCMAAKFFTGLPLDGPDPECVKGHGETALDRARRRRPSRCPAPDHSKPDRDRPCRSRSVRARPPHRSRRTEPVTRTPRRVLARAAWESPPDGQNPWFETVAEAQRRAKKRLPKSVYGALVAGSETGLSLDDNLAAFGELGFAPHVVGLLRRARRWPPRSWASPCRCRS